MTDTHAASALDDIAFLDDSTRPEVPELTGLTPAQRAPGRHLRMIHDHLRENMETLGHLIERTAAGKADGHEVGREAAELAMVANYRRFGNLCGQHCQIVNVHHSIEDEAIFPALAQQGEAFRRVAERLRAEHVVVHELLLRLIDSLVALAEHPDRERFDRTLELYRALERVLLSHLGYEEAAIGDALGYFRIGV